MDEYSEKNDKVEKDGSLKNSIESLEEQIEEANSTSKAFINGIFRGLGTAFGATVVFALLVSLITWFVATTDIVWVRDLVNDFIPQDRL